MIAQPSTTGHQLATAISLKMLYWVGENTTHTSLDPSSVCEGLVLLCLPSIPCEEPVGPDRRFPITSTSLLLILSVATLLAVAGCRPYIASTAAVAEAASTVAERLPDSLHGETEGLTGANSKTCLDVARVPEFSSVETVFDRRGFWQEDMSTGQATRIAHSTNPPLSALVPILMYHSVRPIDFKTANAFVSSLTLPPTEFERELIYLKSRGFTSITMRDLALHLQGEQDLPAKPVVLTFDDGFMNDYQYALPLLKAYGFTGTFFIITGLVGKPEYMTWEQVIDLTRSGMEIGSHTITHPDLTVVAPAVRDQQLSVSKRTLDEKLGVQITSLSYPGGAFNADVEAAARRAGYEVAVTTRYGATHPAAKPMELSRVRIQGTDQLGSFKWKIEQFFPAGGPPKS